MKKELEEVINIDGRKFIERFVGEILEPALKNKQLYRYNANAAYMHNNVSKFFMFELTKVKDTGTPIKQADIKPILDFAGKLGNCVSINDGIYTLEDHIDLDIETGYAHLYTVAENIIQPVLRVCAENHEYKKYRGKIFSFEITDFYNKENALNFRSNKDYELKIHYLNSGGNKFLLHLYQKARDLSKKLPKIK